MNALLSQLAAWCGAPELMNGGAPGLMSGGAPGLMNGGATVWAVAAAMLLAGAAASPLHCAPMCGGFVLGQVSDRMARLPSAHLSECQRLRAAGLAPYHLGRLSTYAMLGAVAGSGGYLVNRIGGAGGVFLLIGAVLLALQAARRLRPGFALPLTRTARGYPLGVALGFLPCGVLYAALSAAAATGSPAIGAIAMICFGLGTVPALVAVGLFGASAGHRFRRGMTALGPAVLLFNAGVLAILGVRMLAGS